MLVLVLCLLAFDADRPRQLPDRAGCEHYRGTARGNDPSVQLDVVLCPQGTDVSGDVQWSSLQSGWNLRRVSGTWDGDALRMRDLKVIEAKPEPGWRFCEIDTYALVRTDGGLAGTYRSAACDDAAELTLTRVDAPTPSPGPQPVAVVDDLAIDSSDPRPAGREPAGSSSPPTRGEDGRAGCGCTSPATGSAMVWLVLLGAFTPRARSPGKR